MFEGKVTINNWAMTRAQRVFRNISFDSEVHDVYNPRFSSEEGDDSDEFADEEEAKGKICDERLSEINPCNDSNESLGL